MDDEPMWAADHVVASTPGSAITIPETANEFAIKESAICLNTEIPRMKLSADEYPPITTGEAKTWSGRTQQRNYQNVEMLRNCHGHNLSKGNIIKIFYHGLSKITQEVPNATLGIDVIDEILEEDFDALLDEGRKILHSIKGILLKEEIFSEFNEFIAMNADENSESESDTKESPF
ncbi:hypothetical protein Tco_0073057 [Tanacetum coccineum]